MDLEPGRCRRTDGKKWRCRWPVLPSQKYCERHIHRGRLRSRKPVEVPETVSTSISTVSSLKPVSNLQSAAINNAINHGKVHIKNQSLKIKKLSRVNALEFGFSPKSVLQNGNVQGCGTSSHDNSIALSVTGSERCRRTDGKKWQCSKDALPKQKYCGIHMHRGAKKVENLRNLNASRSFSVGSSYKQMDDDGNRSNDESSSNPGSSDATTIST
ncbi:growth-regulating factor 7-like [Cynara cardunculus var. scolymus]|nr:growth-regulating factor 7-like [Cynara cardunculus var. scolymus]XP_024997041.1 growth-regulating factor 7-like [Cynara cardunculus var. scolymus]XP_024997042.1 growth-regulating factor 7-like [Cynara cardunculus var. scolymus]XP_024997043.1 growth-regulating factor 7-like [Cynara cardunculus var. scolymus]